MAVNCGVSFGLCRVRVTRVDSNGNVIAGNFAYVTDAALSVSVTPNIETGTAISVRNGCGEDPSFKFPDTFNWFEFAFVDTSLEPVLEAFMLGADTIVDGSDVVGRPTRPPWPAMRMSRRWPSSSGRSTSWDRARTRPTPGCTTSSPCRSGSSGTTPSRRPQGSRLSTASRARTATGETAPTETAHRTVRTSPRAAGGRRTWSRQRQPARQSR